MTSTSGTAITCFWPVCQGTQYCVCCICPLTFYQTSLDILEIYSYTFGIFLPLYDYIVLTMSPAACCTVVC